MPKRIVEEAWIEFSRACMPARVPSDSRTVYVEMRRAFYAGAGALLTSLTPGPSLEDIQGMCDELVEFAERALRGEV